MRDYLTFLLYGPLASWGEVAIGESRHSAHYPSKSALLGLLAAAKGIPRQDETSHLVMAEGYFFAVKCLSAGSFLRDYHTTQVPRSGKRVRYRTRKEELEAPAAQINTVLSRRDYRCDSFSVVAVWCRPTAPYTLAQLKQALERPHYHLYLGRKSCPLSWPLAPQVKEFSGARAALDESSRLAREDAQFSRLTRDERAEYFWEDDALDISPAQTNIRQDQPHSRRRWQFVSRTEFSRRED